MNHEEGVTLSSYVDQELPAAELKRVEAHLSSCASCRAELESLRFTKRLLSSAPRRAMPLDLVAALESSLGRPRSPWTILSRFTTAPKYWAPTAALAAAAALMAFWVNAVDRAPDQYVPLEPLLAAHSRYAAESLVPEDNLVASGYSAPAPEVSNEDQE